MKPVIFFIDDEVDLCECFEDQFSSEHYSIKTYTNPALAIGDSKQLNPVLLFIDYRMPGIKGDSLGFKFSSSIPKYLITGELDFDVPIGFFGVIKKPYNFEEVQRIISRHVLKESPIR